ncbi:hypothetical protein PDO_4471 [Rhizobium sp. PDO1-076]|nr:hypothetical protein PDO_4471 [Rhizobium sp. PDO1-076]
MAPDARKLVPAVYRFEISDPPLKFHIKSQTGAERRRFCFALFCFARAASPTRSSPRQDGEKMPAGR